MNLARVLFFQANLPKPLWNFGIQHSFHLINSTFSPLLNNKTPYQLFYGYSTTCPHLKVFGCLYYAYTLHVNRTKFDKSASKTIFLGYQEGVKCYILYDFNSHQTFIYRNVVFYENHFPFHTHHNASHSISFVVHDFA